MEDKEKVYLLSSTWQNSIDNLKFLVGQGYGRNYLNMGMGFGTLRKRKRKKKQEVGNDGRDYLLWSLFS